MILLEQLFSDEPPRTIDDVETRLGFISEEAGFSNFSYIGGTAMNVTAKGHAMWQDPPIMMMTFPMEWIKLYHLRDYARVDPVVSATLNHRLPIAWDIETFGSIGPEQREFFRNAHDFGIRRGLSIPLYGSMGDFGLMTLLFDEGPSQFKKTIRRYEHELHVAAIHLDQCVRRITMDPKSPVELTEREVEILCWTAAGKTSAETATILAISKKTVDFHLYNAMRKLDVYTKAQAVAKALLQGLIIP